jgi:hypothetical protein
LFGIRVWRVGEYLDTSLENLDDDHSVAVADSFRL